MKLIKLFTFVFIAVFFFSGAVQAETWTAGPALIPGEKSKSYRTAELRVNTSTAKIPVYEGDDLRFKDKFNGRMRKEADRYLLALYGEDMKREVSGWLHWQEGRKGNLNSVIFIEAVMYKGAAHPITYVKGMTSDREGNQVTLPDLQKRMPGLTVDRLRKETAMQCEKRGIMLFDDYHISGFPKEFYIGTDNHIYFIFQQYDIAPYASGWIMIDMGKVS